MTKNKQRFVLWGWFLFFLFLSIFEIDAQNKIRVNSFQRMETDVTARITSP